MVQDLRKTEFIIGSDLDWAVSRANLDTFKKNFVIHNKEPCLEFPFDPEGPADAYDPNHRHMWQALRYSSRWKDGGPIIDKFMAIGMTVEHQDDPYDPIICKIITRDNLTFKSIGENLLVAAMRLFVLLHLGEDLDIQDTL